MGLTGIGLIVLPKSTASACVLSIGSKVLYEIITNKHNNYKKQFEKDQQTFKSSDKSYRKTLKDIVIDTIEYESLCKFFTKYVNENKIVSFL